MILLHLLFENFGVFTFYKIMMINKALANLKIASLNKMQEEAVAVSTKPNDVVLYSPTGSGKTLGFLLPILKNLKADKEGVQAVIIVPARELAIQIEQVFKAMGTGFKINSCYGGHATKVEKNNLLNPPAIIVGTPGRLAFHIRNNSFDASIATMLVLDEFDKALEFGFQEEMSFIIKSLNQLKKRMLTSATRIEKIPPFTGVHNSVTLDFLGTKENKPKGLDIKVVKSKDKDKLDALFGLLCKLGDGSSLVFCNHRESVDRISELLWDNGIFHGVFHGGMEQIDRERALIKLRNGTHKILVTTDLAARGLDIPEIEAVIHYQAPFTEDVFIHRNGRTARMKAKGTSYLILGPSENAPKYIKKELDIERIGKQKDLPPMSEWKTVYIGSGKKDKINKIDIVGLLLKKGNLKKDELGLIEVLDRSSYAAVNASKAEALIGLLANERIKNKKVKIEIAK